ncbi:MAG: diguanylate cyclase domain-containing protein [Bacillota bacterium]
MKSINTNELEKFFDLALDLLCIADTKGNFIKVNRAWEEILGYPVHELESRKFLDFVHPADIDATVETMKELEKQKQVINFVNRYQSRDGSYRYIEWRSYPFGDHIYAAARDITERMQAEIIIKASESRSRALIEAIPDMLFRYDREGRYLDAQIKNVYMLHPVAREKYEQKDLIGRKVEDVLPSDVAKLIQEMIKNSLESGDLQVADYSYAIDGEEQHFEARLVATENEEAVSIVREITEQKQSEEKLKYLSLHDSLTGLHNRAYFQSELDRLEGSRYYPIAIISADLDGLKLINDTLGHKEGDNFLMAGAALLEEALRSSDLLARVGGDEFALVLPQTDREAGEQIVRRILERVSIYNRQRVGMPLSISVGLAISDGVSKSLEDTYHAADTLMYKDKLKRSKEARSAIIEALLASLFKREGMNEESSEKVQELCIILGQQAGLDEEQMANLMLLAQVYELGKITIPEEILSKPGKLSEQEWDIVKQHAEKGYRIAAASPELASIAELLLKHHEQWDGKGYPLGLQGEEIPVECRILLLVNAYYAMISPRPYAKTMDKEEALQEVASFAGTQFDPKLVEIFLEIV